MFVVFFFHFIHLPNIVCFLLIRNLFSFFSFYPVITHTPNLHILFLPPVLLVVFLFDLMTFLKSPFIYLSNFILQFLYLFFNLLLILFPLHHVLLYSSFFPFFYFIFFSSIFPLCLTASFLSFVY